MKPSKTQIGILKDVAAGEPRFAPIAAAFLGNMRDRGWVQLRKDRAGWFVVSLTRVGARLLAGTKQLT
jgi:hypothetical protein